MYIPEMQTDDESLTQIHGELTYEGVHKLRKELMVNVQTVHSDLGGGAHGHLGLVLSS